MNMYSSYDTAHEEVTRVEVIGPGGVDYVGYYEKGVVSALQDDGRTLKIFVGLSISAEEFQMQTTKAFLKMKEPTLGELGLCGD